MGGKEHKEQPMALVAETVSLEIIRSVRKPLERIRRHDAALAKQLRDAVNSIGLNVSEGERRTGGDRLYHYRVAAGSAKEAQRNLLQAEAWGHVSAEEIEAPLRHLDRELGLLWGLTHSRH